MVLDMAKKRRLEKEPNPLANVGTSAVFYMMHNGFKTTKDISRELGIKPPDVIQQLRRLEAIGVVKKSGKRGRTQNYEIAWDEFQKVYLEHALKPRKFKKKRDKYVPNPKEVARTDSIKNKLVKNACFADFLEEFIGIYSAECHVLLSDHDYSPPAILDTVWDLDLAIVLLCPRLKPKKPDSEMRKFLDGLRAWCEWSSDALRYPFGEIKEILEGMGLI